ncbi:isoleucyl-tRNA synthetase [Achromobacter sp. Root170]|nr:isoleucyl-tRNA synthetase [Achromobacter sp. Root170]
MRNLAQDMDTHLLNDVGAPQWLVNEVALSRDLARLRNNHHLRW